MPCYLPLYSEMTQYAAIPKRYDVTMHDTSKNATAVFTSSPTYCVCVCYFIFSATSILQGTLARTRLPLGLQQSTIASY